jgi:hypothetical protein
MENTKLTPRGAFETIYSRLNFLERDCLYGEEAEVVREALDSMAILCGGYFPPEPDSELGVK